MKNRKNSHKRKFKYNLGVNDPHIRNKNEGEVLRKIMSNTHLNEDEVLNIKKYRCELSNAQKKQGGKTRDIRNGISLLKLILKECKLPKEHPEVKRLFFEQADSRRRYDIWWMDQGYKSMFNTILKYYKNKKN